MLVSPAFCFAQKNKPVKVYDLLIGTWTKPGGSKGIYVYRFYAETGKVAYLSELDNIDNPSYLALSKDYKYVYAANEGRGAGGASAYKFDAKTGKLDTINTQKGGGGPTYVSIDKDRKFAFIANYGGGNLTVYPINKDGSLEPFSQKIQDVGSGPNKARQAGPHVHTAVFTPDNKYLLFTDLGTDKINVYKFDGSKKEPLTPADEPVINAIPGNGPRHIDFSKDGKFMYNIQEMGGAITAYTYNNGKFKAFQTVTITPEGFTGTVGASDVHVSPDGKFLYATNRGTVLELLVYAINQQTGELTYVDRYKTGKEPRNFIIEPAGNFLLLASQLSNIINIYKIDKTTGKLTIQPQTIEVGQPTCLKLVPVE